MHNKKIMNNMVYDTRTPRPKQTRPEYPSSQKKKPVQPSPEPFPPLYLFILCSFESYRTLGETNREQKQNTGIKSAKPGLLPARLHLQTEC
ncbi:hypothetical protein BDV34DRAFT_112080 [Aspergillus parasiticus]|uniref:Uncharacterized protein n=1 Tax=Aspergillus parasiticus TaxID=5067 RepID=A0A5N6DHS0_ASPPA|nr:hypothetical protein BDV34DRAFT_112080 [Aspergillus parasiticus]